MVIRHMAASGRLRATFRRPGAVLAAIVATCGASARTQQLDAEKVAAAAEKWVTSDQVSRELLDLTVTVMLADAKLGIDWLAAQLPEADKAPALPRSKGVHGLCTHCVLDFL